MNYFDTAIFGVLISIIAFEIGIWLNKKTKSALVNPLIIAIVLVVVFLLVFNIDYEIYNKGGSIISFFLGPATVVLAVPLYKQIEKLKENAVPIIAGILVGSIVAILSVIYLGKLFKLDEVIILSLIPKSTTAAISMEISKEIGGIPALTMAATVIAGISGNIIGTSICKLFKIEYKTSIGLGLGTASHAVGTAKAMELGEIEGAMSSLSIGIAGLITVIIVPWFIKILL
ncbi:MAG: LrgB family protein [Tissierellia bacterium]|nr:LrgB family protein [Tissierellia bacterium]